MCLCFIANDDLQGAKNAVDNYQFEDPTFENSRQFEFLCGIVVSIEDKNPDKLSKVVRDNARIMSLDKTNTKLLVTIRKLHIPDDPVEPAPTVQTDVNQLNLVDGGDDHPAEQEPAEDAAVPESNDGFDLC